MQADMHDDVFYFQENTGIPKLSDSVLVDAALRGEGLTVHVVSSFLVAPLLILSFSGHLALGVARVQGQERRRQCGHAQVLNPRLQA